MAVVRVPACGEGYGARDRRNFVPDRGEVDPRWADPRWDEGLITELRDLYTPLRRFAAIVARHDVDPDDLVQETFTKLLLLERSRIDNLGAYARRIVVNLAHNERRRAGRGAAAVRRLADGDGAHDVYPSDLHDLLQLEPRSRALLLLVDVEGTPIADAADQLGLAPAAARMALTRARRRLARALQGDNDR